MTMDAQCKHDEGFKPQTLYVNGIAQAGWGCNRLCGYHLNFNPEYFIDSVALLDKPSPDKTWKNPPELKSNEVDR